MSAEKPRPVKARRSIGRVLLALTALALFAALAWVIQGKLREEVWAYFTDNAGTKVGVEEEKARRVLWEDPKPNNFTEQRDPQALPQELTGQADASRACADDAKVGLLFAAF